MAELNCEEVGRWIEAFADDELDGVTSRLVEEHLAGCPTCRIRLGWDREVRQSLRSWGEQVPVASVGLRQRVLHAPARVRPARFWMASGLAAVLALSAGGVWLGIRSEVRRDSTLMAFVANHQATVAAAKPPVLHTADPGEAERWLTTALGRPVQVPRPLQPFVQLTGTRLCSVRGNIVGYLAYEVAGQPVSCFIEPAVDSVAGQPREAIPPAVEQCKGKTVVSWAAADSRYVAVGEVDATRLLALAFTQ